MWEEFLKQLQNDKIDICSNGFYNPTRILQKHEDEKVKYTTYMSPLFVLQGICILNSDDILEVILVGFSIFCLNLKVTYHIVSPTTMWKSPKSWVSLDLSLKV
jgi:hypothetical protein